MSLIIYNRIKSVLAEKGMTQEWLAEKGDWNAKTVSKWCTNRIQPTIKNLFAVAGFLNCSPGDLLLTKAETRPSGTATSKVDLRAGIPRKAKPRKK